VVYPRAVCRLVETYRFRQVGGASAKCNRRGVVAAAEHGRDRGGFDAPHALPEDLGSRLPTLFQPSPRTRGAFAVLTAWLEPAWRRARKAAMTGVRVVRYAPVAALLGFAAVGLSAVLGGRTAWWLAIALVVAAVADVVAAAGACCTGPSRRSPAMGLGSVTDGWDVLTCR
jgi:hypothetical protein